MYGALAYNAEKVEAGQGKVLGANKVCYGSDGLLGLNGCLRDFSAHMPSHIATKKPIVHISLNPHPDDKLSDEELSAIATEWLERMGYGDQPYVVYKHEDIDRHHIHIVTLGVDAQGKKLDDGNNFYRSKKITRDLEQRYRLLPAEKQQETEVYRYAKVDVVKGEVKKQVASVVKPLAKNYHFLSLNEFRALLSLYNIAMEEVKGEVRGKPYQGVVYTATDDKGVKVGTPLKSSLFGQSVGLEALNQRIEQSKVQIKEQRLGVETKQMILARMKSCRNLPELEKKLSLQGIDTVLRRNDTGRIYGATFIDHNCRCVLNGSRMGKELSVNALQAWASSPHPVGQGVSQEPKPSEPQCTPANDPSPLGGVFDLPIDPQNCDPEEEAFRRRMQRKKRRKKV